MQIVLFENNGPQYVPRAHNLLAGNVINDDNKVLTLTWPAVISFLNQRGKVKLLLGLVFKTSVSLL